MPKHLLTEAEIRHIKHFECKDIDNIVVDGIKYHNMDKIKKPIKDEFDGEIRCVIVKSHERKHRTYINEDDFKEQIDKKPYADAVYIKMKWLSLAPSKLGA
jgi:hypothetical protein